jgi:hypothetical protein
LQKWIDKQKATNINMLVNIFHNKRSKVLPDSKCLLKSPEKKALLNNIPGNKNTIM